MNDLFLDLGAVRVAPPVIENIVKRDGRIVPFDAERIESALRRCYADIRQTPRESFATLVEHVVNLVAARHDRPTVEDVQDAVETVLLSAGEYGAAKSYILYRHEHAKLRAERPIPLDVQAQFAEASHFFRSPIQQFQFFDKYARFDWDQGRRETWVETVDRAVSFLAELANGGVDGETLDAIRQGVLNMRVMPSMRLLAMAGPAARRSHVTIYNCSYMPVDSIDAFVEALIISMCGCGVGFSVESRYVEQLPRIRRQTGKDALTFAVEDSADGWADALRVGLNTWYQGGDIRFDLSKIRPAGSPLRTKGGTASGPEPLRRILNFARSRILARQGGFLRTVDAHDIMCAVGGGAVAGGMRRSAMISLFDWYDQDMRLCKSGDFEQNNPQRWNANNSAVLPEEDGLSQAEVTRFMLDMLESGRGEPGIFNRRAALATKPKRRAAAEFGTNPCGEISLRPYEFCNLSISVARQDDTYETLAEKVKLAAIIGTIQSMATYFPGLRSMWKQNCEEERLTGVDITGQMDCPLVQEAGVLRDLRQVAVQTNKQWAKRLGINQSASVTCVKPSGNSSQLLNCSSGLHARFAPYYIRNVRVGAATPVFAVLRDAGVPMDPENGQSRDRADTWVAHFPVKSPEGAVLQNGRSALEQMAYWLKVKRNYTEHNPSVTITYRPDEVLDVLKWVWEHQDEIGGMAFLPASDAKYNQMPYEEISRAEFEVLDATFPEIDWSKLWRYEQGDNTTAAQELACMSGVCLLS